MRGARAPGAGASTTAGQDAAARAPLRRAPLGLSRGAVVGSVAARDEAPLSPPLPPLPGFSSPYRAPPVPHEPRMLRGQGSTHAEARPACQPHVCARAPCATKSRPIGWVRSLPPRTRVCSRRRIARRPCRSRRSPRGPPGAPSATWNKPPRHPTVGRPPWEAASRPGRRGARAGAVRAARLARCARRGRAPLDRREREQEHERHAQRGRRRWCLPQAWPEDANEHERRAKAPPPAMHARRERTALI